MVFPILHIPGLGDGMTIALDAVLHVLISHGLAIGFMTVLVLFQTLAWRGKGAFWARIARRLLGTAVVITTSVGAVTGVGIWFITGALAPEGIGALIHLFFWPWFIEWMAFTSEVSLLLVYYYLWDKLQESRPGLLAAVGWSYVTMAVISAILISGILGFMLTPDAWPWGQAFTEAYFNPTFIPQVFLRLGAGLCLGALLALGWIAWRFDGTGPQRARALRCTGGLALGAALVAGLSAWVYFSRIPATYLTHWKFAVATSYLSQLPDFLPLLNLAAALCIVLAALAGACRRPLLSRALCIPALLCCVTLFMEFERVREFVRGPYLVPGYMYANQIPLAENEALLARNAPLLPRASWINVESKLSPRETAGRALFAANCGVCHAESGINGIDHRLAGRSLDGVAAMVGITQHLAPYMTPFTGSEEERLLLAHYIYGLATAHAGTDRTVKEK